MTSSSICALDTRPDRTLRSAVSDLLTLTKPEVNFLIVIATFTGFYLGHPDGPQGFPIARLLITLLGTMLVASGAGALNQYLEFPFDARMRRTWRRPVASGRLSAGSAAWFGVTLSVIGAADLLFAVNAISSALAVLTSLGYLFIYTPLKRNTPLCTLAGAFPGAMPPLIGWAAAAGSLRGAEPWALYALLFLWQFPHFMAIAWMYREDYARAGYLVLPDKQQSRFLAWQTVAPSFVLLPVSLAIVAVNDGGALYYSATLALGVALLYYASRQLFLQSRATARELLKASIIYLPVQFVIFVLGRN
jgi:protoheme IX farnesyltransferase